MRIYSDRGRILPPNLDDRTWQDFVDELRALIPKYAPQWTDQSPSDLGMTLIELFAWLVEGMTYRLNRVPEKNYLAYLSLLGITRNPAVPAGLFLTFESSSGPILVPKGNQAQTRGSETEPPLIFETDAEVLVLPTNLRIALEQQKATGTTTDISTALTVPPAKGIGITIAARQIVQLCLGFDEAVVEEIALHIKLFRPVQLDAPDDSGVAKPQVEVLWLYSTEQSDPWAWQVIPQDRLIDGTQGLQHDGVVSFRVPTDWRSHMIEPATSPFFWISLRLSNVATPETSVNVGFDYLLFNAVSAHNALTIPEPELLGLSNEHPYQVFQLRHYPLFKQTGMEKPYSHLVVQVGGETWQQVNDFPAGEGKYYRLDPVAGEISFGDFDSVSRSGHGSIPPRGSSIVAKTYRYVAGGLAGNVGAGQVTSMRTTVPGITAVANLAASSGAANEETIEDTMRQAPEMLKIRDRAVSLDDYEFLVAAATTAVARTRCLAPRLNDDGTSWTYGGIDRSPGNVNVIIVPDQGWEVATPEPPTDLMYEVQQYLDTRRDLTAHLLVLGPRYLPIKTAVTAVVWSTAVSKGEIKKNLGDELKKYFHPIRGGPDGRGWQIRQSVYQADLYKALMSVLDPNVGYISDLTITASTPLYDPPMRPPGLLANGSLVQLADYELVCYDPKSTVEVEEK